MQRQQLDLSSFLKHGLLSTDKSVEIPKLKRKFWTNNKTGQTYVTVRYDKLQLLSDDYDKEGLLRSLVFNANGKVLSFAPPKSYNWTMNNNSTLYDDDDTLVAEEFVDGTMINLFWDDTIRNSDGSADGNWEITTRSCVGANIGFYLHDGSRTFRDMFFETCQENNFLLDYLPKKASNGNHLCYSFVLQHKDNRIVVPYQSNSVYLIEVYEIEQTDSQLVVYPYNKSEDSEKIYDTLFDRTNIKYPVVYTSGKASDNMSNINSLLEQYATTNTPYYVQGLVIKNLSRTTRGKIRNPVYEEVRHIRGNQPKIQYRYFALRQQNKVKDYLKYYPEDKTSFNLFRKQLHDYTNTLYSNYVNCFIKKQKPLEQFPYKYRNHMVQLHKQYIDILREDGKYITKGFVIQYMNNLPPPQQMFVVNYEMRKRHTDTIVANSELEQSISDV